MVYEILSGLLHCATLHISKKILHGNNACNLYAIRHVYDFINKCIQVNVIQVMPIIAVYGLSDCEKVWGKNSK